MYQVLSNFKQLRDPEKSRQDYLDILIQDVTTYYGYTASLVEYFLSQFSPAEVLHCTPHVPYKCCTACLTSLSYRMPCHWPHATIQPYSRIPGLASVSSYFSSLLPMLLHIQALELFQANEKPRPITIRVNTLKALPP